MGIAILVAVVCLFLFIFFSMIKDFFWLLFNLDDKIVGILIAVVCVAVLIYFW